MRGSVAPTDTNTNRTSLLSHPSTHPPSSSPATQPTSQSQPSSNSSQFVGTDSTNHNVSNSLATKSSFTITSVLQPQQRVNSPSSDVNLSNYRHSSTLSTFERRTTNGRAGGKRRRIARLIPVIGCEFDTLHIVY